jgi:dTDP-4-dehydrorhamnose reductase
MKVLITGSQGMLGQDLVKVFEISGHDVISATRKDLDITNQSAVNDYIRIHRPDVIINAAAYNLVDRVEEPQIYDIAYRINAIGPENLAIAAQNIGAKFVHFSTDYVFNGQKNDYYLEDDLPNPISKYGYTKLMGEKFAQDACDKAYICRVVKLFGLPAAGESAKEGFVDMMLRLNKTLPDLKIADDEFGTPTYSLDVANTVENLVSGNYAPGIYHIINEGEPVSVFGFAKEIFEMLGIKDNYRPCTRSEFPRAAKCPHFSPLRNTKLPKLRSRKDALSEFLKNISVSK